MPPNQPKLRTLRELADEAEVPPRTVRFYIARGLLSGPVVAGRGAVYGDEHLARLRSIRRLQSEGRTLAEIGPILNGPAAENDVRTLSSIESWARYRLAGDVEVMVRDGASPWRTRQLRAALKEFADRLRAIGTQEEDEHAEHSRHAGLHSGS